MKDRRTDMNLVGSNGYSHWVWHTAQEQITTQMNKLWAS